MLLLHQLEFLSMRRAHGYDHASTVAQLLDQCGRQLGCSGCHAAGSTVHAPLLDGLLGREVHLQDGRTLVADDNYVRDSILLPRKDVVAGFEPVMPSFAGQLDEDELVAIIAYIESTSR